MGWTHPSRAGSSDWADRAELSSMRKPLATRHPPLDESTYQNFDTDPLYRACVRLSVELGSPWTKIALKIIRLRKNGHHSAIGGGAKRSATNIDDLDEIGMTLAYLKRALQRDHDDFAEFCWICKRDLSSDDAR